MTPIEELLDKIPYEDIDTSEVVSDGSLYAIKKGILDLGVCKLTVYVLNNGQRIFDANELENFLMGIKHE